MKLKLQKPLIFFDLETTGVNIATDRIVEIAILKLYPNGNKESNTWLVNPTVPIPKESSDIHGITNEKVANEPTFKELASKIYDIIKGCDLAGFNSNRFDIPLLAEEMLRAEVDIDLSNVKAIDVQTIFHKKEQRTLSAGYQFYCGKDLTDAHSATADTLATYEILMAQVEKYDDLGGDVTSLSDYSAHQKRADFAGYVMYNAKGEEIFTFGKYKNRKVLDVFAENPGYFGWIENADFPLYTKKVINTIRLKSLNNKLK